MTLRERWRQRTPVLDRPTESVHEHERRTVTGNCITKPRAVHHDVAVVESLETGVAVCHLLGVFFRLVVFATTTEGSN
jgi:hypothetical protein